MNHIRAHLFHKSDQPFGGGPVSPSVYTCHTAFQRGNIDFRGFVDTVNIGFLRNPSPSECHIGFLPCPEKLSVYTGHDSGGAALVIMAVNLQYFHCQSPRHPKIIFAASIATHSIIYSLLYPLIR